MPRIEQPNVEPGEVPDISRHQNQSMLNGHGGNLGVGGCGAAAGAIAVAHEASPDGGRADVERQDASVELPGEVLLANRSRRSCILAFRAPRTSSPMVWAARKRSDGFRAAIQSRTGCWGLGRTVSLTTLVSRR